jgi:rhamnogalacturonyl hydrolase YesR
MLVERVKRATLAMQRHAWEQGVVAQAFLEQGERETVILMAREAAQRQAPDGRLALVGADFQVTDPAANGEAVLYAARITGDAFLQSAADRMLDYLLHHAPRAEDGTLYHINNAPQMWIDSGYMAPPFLAVAGEPGEAVRQVEGLRKRLWDPGKKLYSHIWDEGKQEFGRRAFWGVGNGWMLAGMVRVMHALPAEMALEKERLLGYIKEGLDGCLTWMRPDGLLHDVVDDPATFVDTNLPQMLAYTIYRGLQHGWLDASYRPFAERMRAAAQAKVDEWGFVRDVCGYPNFDRAWVAPEGQAFFLLMEAAARDVGN